MLSWIVWGLGVFAIVATILPLVPTDEGWVRVFDFPRLQLAVLAAANALAAALVLDWRRRRIQAFLILLAASFAYQALEIYPFTPLAPKEVASAAGCQPDGRVSLLIANVLMANRTSEPFLRMTRRLAPDLVLVTESDRWWDRQLESLAGSHPHAVRYPLDNTYGMHLYSRLPLLEPEVRFLVQDDVPSIHTRVRLRSGRLFDFYGVHPRPPRPARDTTPRDVELVVVGRQAAADARPTIVAGDLNDVGWSATTRLFKEISGLLDPRVGRGVYATFNANWPFLRWPLDHVFVDGSFRLVRLQRLGDIGSDHFPIFIETCRQP